MRSGPAAWRESATTEPRPDLRSYLTTHACPAARLCCAVVPRRSASHGRLGTEPGLADAGRAGNDLRDGAASRNSSGTPVGWGTFATIMTGPLPGNSLVRANVGRRFAAALLPRLFGKNPRSHHKGATGRVRTGNQRLLVLCHCQLGQDIPVILTLR